VGGQGSGDGALKDMIRLDAHAKAQLEKDKEVAPKGVVISSSTSGPKGKGKKRR
jgi:hypothetical protein